MTDPHRPSAPKAQVSSALAAARPWVVTPNGQPARAMPMTRRYEVLWQDRDGQTQEMSRIAPAMPVFEAAFAAFARGALVETPSGPVAIEDLLPGTYVNTDMGPRPVRWIGRITLPPANMRQDESPNLYRLHSDAFGLGRPSPDVVLCSAARLVHRSAQLASTGRLPEVLVPIADFADGVNVTRISPMSAVTAYNIALDEHAILQISGLSLESFHPGAALTELLSGDLLRLYLSLFPYLRTPSEFGKERMLRMALEEIAARYA